MDDYSEIGAEWLQLLIDLITAIFITPTLAVLNQYINYTIAHLDAIAWTIFTMAICLVGYAIIEHGKGG